MTMSKADWEKRKLAKYGDNPKVVEAAKGIVDRTIVRLQALHEYVGRPAWDKVIAEELAAYLAALPIEPQAPDVEPVETGFDPSDRADGIAMAIATLDGEKWVRLSDHASAIDQLTQERDAANLSKKVCVARLEILTTAGMIEVALSNPNVMSYMEHWESRAETAEAENARLLGVMSGASGDILAERARQISAKGWTPEHDDQHVNHEMTRAATCYILGNGGNWPWDWAWWKPADRRRNLVKAAALVLAEIERLDRAALSPKPQGGER